MQLCELMLEVLLLVFAALLRNKRAEDAVAAFAAYESVTVVVDRVAKVERDERVARQPQRVLKRLDASRAAAARVSSQRRRCAEKKKTHLS